MCVITFKYAVERQDSADRLMYLGKVTYPFYSFRLYWCKVNNKIIENIAATDDTAMNIPENILR